MANIFTIIDENKEKLLVNLAETNGWKLEDVVSIYLVIGNDLFFLMDVLRGKSFQFSKSRSLSDLNKVSEKIEVKEIFLFELDKYKIGTRHEINGVVYEVKRNPEKVFGRYYVVFRRVKDD